MKRLLTFILILFNFNIISAQEQAEVTGQVKEALTKNAIELCSVYIVSPKDSLIKSCVTDKNGYFTISLNQGYYRFIISYVGYKSDTTAVTAITENIFLGIFKLKANEKLLKEVSVKASSHENLIDRDEQVVTDKMKAGATDTKDVLEKVNGVEYDRYNNTIKVDNDSKVLILVDGMEKDQEYIKNLAPDRLKKVEVIRSPGGRYALEGYSAVINIILKKDYQGTEVYLNERNILDHNAFGTKNFFVQNDLSGTVNYVYNKLNVYAKYSKDYNNFNFPTSDIKTYNNNSEIEEIPSTTDVNGVNTNVKTLDNNYTLGADYYINPKHTISFEGNLTTTPAKYNTTDLFYKVDYIKNDVGIEDFFSHTLNQTENKNSYHSLFYNGKLDENNVINSNFTYSNYNDKYLNIYTNTSPDSINQQGKDNKNSTKFYVEYTHTFNAKNSLQIGYGNTWQQQNSNLKTNAVDSNFTYSDFRHRLYAYYSWQGSKKFSVKLGAAAETSNPDANGIEHNYIIFQPYADIKYVPSKFLSLKLKYRTRTTYPNIDETNPFTTVIDAQSIKTGNPYLHPEVNYKISLQTDILGGLITTEPYFYFSDNFITQTGSLNSDSIFKYTYNNAGYYRHYGDITRFTIPLNKNLSWQNNFDYFRSTIKFTGNTNTLDCFTVSSQLIYQNKKSNSIIGLKFQRELYNNITALGYNNDGDNDYWILILRQPFFKQKLNVLLVYFLPVNWGVDFKQGSFIKTENYSETTVNDISYLKNMLLLQLSYRFNKGKSVNNTDKDIEKEDEKTTKKVL